MKVAVTANGTSVEGEVDQRFGRARYFVVVDTESDAVEVQDNEVNLNAAQGAGIQSAQNLAAIGVSAVLTGHLGPNAFRTLSAAGIKAYTGAQGKIAEAIKEFKAGKLTPVDSADVEGHW